MLRPSVLRSLPNPSCEWPVRRVPLLLLLLTSLPALAQVPAGTPETPASTATTTETPAAPVASETPATPAEPAVPAPPTPEEIAAAKKKFDDGQLKRKDVLEGDPRYDALLRAHPKAAPWMVTNGAGSVIPAREFATLTADKATIERMNKDKKRAKTTALGLVIGGGVIAATSVVPLLFIDSEGGNPGAQPSLQKYASQEDYVIALEQWRAARTVEGQNGSRVWTAVALGTSGGLLIASAPFAKRGAAERQDATNAWYSMDDAQERMGDYNRELAQSLGIIPPDAPKPKAVKIELDPELEDELEDEPSAPLEERADEPEQSEDPPEDAGGPDEPPLLQLHPVIGLGFLGLSGSF